ncbi:MAG: hypothetical protein QOJ09_2029 [Actinomycetota bacterium]|jgi:hypothetical protein|nr:hypothetical protein [Actinomycetota bacterium]
MTFVTIAVLDPPVWVMPTIALVGPLLVVVATLLLYRGRSDDARGVDDLPDGGGG